MFDLTNETNVSKVQLAIFSSVPEKAICTIQSLISGEMSFFPILPLVRQVQL